MSARKSMILEKYRAQGFANPGIDKDIGGPGPQGRARLCKVESHRHMPL